MTTQHFALFAPYLPAPAHSGGRIRIQEFARALSELAEVSLFACADTHDLSEHGADPELGIYASTHLFRSAHAWLPSSQVPARARRSTPKALRQRFELEHARRNFDALVVEHVHAAGVALAHPTLPWVLDEHNIESAYLREKLRARARLTRFTQGAELRALERFERRAWQRASRVVCVSESDAEVIARARGSAPVVIGNGVRADSVPFVLPSRRVGHELLFVGVLGHPPNAAAALWLAREVLPRVKRSEPRARLVLCGADPAPEVRALHGSDVEVTGRVASVAPYLGRAAVYVNALRHGAGTSLKVLEALASGIPLVSSPEGVRGFALQDGEHYACARSAEECAALARSAMRDRAELDAQASRGRAFALGLDFRELGTRFAALVAELTAARRSQRELVFLDASPGDA